MKTLKILTALAVVFAFGCLEAKTVKVLKLSGVINSSSAGFLTRGIEEAGKDGTECLVIELNTSGGVDTSIQKAVQAIISSKVPVISYIYPRGAKAESAGLLIALSSDYLAMAEDTKIGMSQPLNISGKIASEKILDAAILSIKNAGAKRGRDLSWVDDVVKNNKEITAAEALNKKITDDVSNSLFELMGKLDGKKLKTSTGEKKLDLKDADVKNFEMTGKETLMNALGNPNIAYVLFLLGIYALVFEIATPGFGLFGVLGAMLMIIAIMSFIQLPVSIAGLALIVLAVVFFMLEIKTMTHGALAVGGVISLLAGSLLVFNPMMPFFKISLSMVLSMAVVTTAVFALIISIGIAGLRGKVVSGMQGLAGATGPVKTELKPEGLVFINNEDWSAESLSGETIKKGEIVKVVKIEGVKLLVEKQNK